MFWKINGTKTKINCGILTFNPTKKYSIEIIGVADFIAGISKAKLSTILTKLRAIEP